jgi:hypothetical protein
MLKFIIAAVALLAVAGGLSYWTLGRGDDSAEAEVQVVRWGNVTVQVSEETGVVAAGDYALTGARQPVLVLKRGDSFVDVDAETGQVVQEQVAEGDRAAMQEVLATLEVSEQDIATAPWPYSDMPPVMPRERLGNITYVPPDPASGFKVSEGIGDTFTSRGSIQFIRIANARSSMIIDAGTGLVDASGLDHVAAEDKEAFQRFLSEVELVAP